MICKKIIVFILSLSAMACAVQPMEVIPVDYTYEPPVKIGFVSLISEKPTHSHIGITVFGNFVKDIDVNWQLNKHIFSSLSQEFYNQKGYELIDISKDSASYQLFDNDNLMKKEGEFVNLNPAEIERITNQLKVKDLDALVVVRSIKVFYNKNFEVIKESMGRQGDHGFKSAAGQGMTFNSGIGINMYSISPKPHYVGWQYLGLVGQKVDPQPEDYESLTENELASYEKQLKDNMNIKIQEFVSRAP